MQRYRSGHNGADSKSVCGQPHVGSNPTRCANSEIPTTVPFPPWGENCTLVGIFLPSGRIRCAGSRPDFEADIRFASSGYVGARSAPLHFQAAFFRGRLKIAFRSYAPFYQIEPAGPGLDLVGDAYLRKDGFGILLQKADLIKGLLLFCLYYPESPLCWMLWYLWSARSQLSSSNQLFR